LVITQKRSIRTTEEKEGKKGTNVVVQIGLPSFIKREGKRKEKIICILRERFKVLYPFALLLFRFLLSLSIPISLCQKLVVRLVLFCISLRDSLLYQQDHTNLQDLYLFLDNIVLAMVVLVVFRLQTLHLRLN
jgi:hypothetical protein